jgi:hypothetical protein
MHPLSTPSGGSGQAMPPTGSAEPLSPSTAPALLRAMASQEGNEYSDRLSADIGIGRVRRALASTLELWDTCEKLEFADGRDWDQIFRELQILLREAR